MVYIAQNTQNLDGSNEAKFKFLKKMETIKVPARMLSLRKSPYVTVIFPEDAQTFWDDICKAFREAAKIQPHYVIPVDNGGVNGISNNGSVIRINNLGKWLFGTPGYKGHVVYEQISSTEFRVHYPEGAPKEVRELLEKITAEAIILKCRWWGNKYYQRNWMGRDLK